MTRDHNSSMRWKTWLAKNDGTHTNRSILLAFPIYPIHTMVFGHFLCPALCSTLLEWWGPHRPACTQQHDHLDLSRLCLPRPFPFKTTFFSARITNCSLFYILPHFFLPMKAYVTLLTSESYVPGALTLAKTLKHLNTEHKLVVLLDLLAISGHSMALINKVFDDVIQINDYKITAPLEKVASKLGREELAVTYSKVLLWNLDKYDQIIYLDADTLPLKNLDHLFDKFESLAPTEIVASPDIGWPDIFNSGMFVMKPSKSVFEKLVAHSETQDASFDGADQGLLNEFFHLQDTGHTWKRLPFVYNVTPSAHYQYRPALARFFNEINLVHFIGSQKPWQVKHAEKDPFHQLWWDKFNSFYTEEFDRIKLLSTLPSEGYNLKITKLVNEWDKSNEETYLPHLDQLSVGDADKLFPWEHREQVPPTRVFEKVDFALEAGSVKPKKVTLDEVTPTPLSKTKPLKEKYDQFTNDTKFDPEKSLDEVAQLPLKMLSKKK